MAKSVNRITAKQVQTLGAGLHRDGDGLLLKVEPSGSRRWLLRVSIAGKRTELGLGSATEVGLAEARHKASEMREKARAGVNPAAERRAAVAQAKALGVTFEEAFHRFWKLKAPTLSNGKHSKQWGSTLETYAYPTIGRRPVSEVTTSEIVEILEPIWHEKPETASRVLQRLHAVFEASIALGLRQLANPTTGVKRLLGPQNCTGGHFRSLSYAEVPKFMAWLRASDSDGFVTRLAVEFSVLTAARSGEVRGARWSEIKSDCEAVAWRIPAVRMKSRKEHVVPLQGRCVEILDQISALSGNGTSSFPAVVTVTS